MSGLTAFRRLVALAGGDAERRPTSPARLLDWTEWTQRRWVYDYWNAGQPADRVATFTPAEDTVA